jgi:hypothetical protein
MGSSEASRVLLREKGQVSSSDSKTVKLHSFDVSAGVETLGLKFDYSPRVSRDSARNGALVDAALARHNKNGVRDVPPGEERLAAQKRLVQNLYTELNNLMNVVLIDPRGSWRGRWDRNPSSDDGALFLGRAFASKGFLAGEILPGRWTAAIECHGIFVDRADYEVSVFTRGPLSAEEIESHSVHAPHVAPRPLRGPGWYFGEMHSHTLHSDGRNEVHELAGKGGEAGLDFVALTDHNTVSGHAELHDLAITLLHGCEITTFHGHHPIYGITEMPPWHVDGRVRGIGELSPLVRGAGGLVSVAHPFKMGDPVCTGCRMPEGLDASWFDLMEVWYRRWDAAESDNEAGYALWNRYWREGHRITAVAARDWHGPSPEPFPGPYPLTGVFAADDSEAAILAGLRSGRVIMSGGPIIDLALSSGGTRAQMGSSVTGSSGELEIDITRLDGPAELRIYRSGALLVTSALSGDGVHDFAAPGKGWYRAELWRDEFPLCITNHVTLD